MKHAAAVLIASILCISCLTTALAKPSDWKLTAKSKEDARLQSQKWKIADDDGQDSQDTLKEWFADWMDTHGKEYPTKQAEMKAFKAFKESLKRARKVNEDKTLTHWSAPTQYADMTPEEFQDQVLMTVDPMSFPSAQEAKKQVQTVASDVQNRKLLQSLPAKYVNWAKAQYVTPVRNQGNCGSCWAHAATAVVESQYLIQKGNTYRQQLNMSEQEITSCVNSANGNYWSNGCNGGNAGDALTWIQNVNQTTEKRYPYTSGNTGSTGSCYKNLVASNPGETIRVTKPLYYSDKSATQLMAAVDKQPVAFYMNVQQSFYDYAGGIYKPYSGECTDSSVNHVMVVVGYNWTGSVSSSYWFIRNSWGNGWGERPCMVCEKGYMRVWMMADGTSGYCNMYTGITGVDAIDNTLPNLYF